MSTFRRRLMMTQTQGQGRLPTAYQEVEYIECQGDGAYINTDIKGDVSITTSLDGCFTSTATGTKVFLGLGTSAGNWIGQYNRKYAVRFFMGFFSILIQMHLCKVDSNNLFL